MNGLMCACAAPNKAAPARIRAIAGFEDEVRMIGGQGVVRRATTADEKGKEVDAREARPRV